MIGQGEIESAASEGISRFGQEYMGHGQPRKANLVSGTWTASFFFGGQSSCCRGMNKARRPGPEEWRQIIDGHGGSGLTVAAYCLERGITSGRPENPESVASVGRPTCSLLFV